MGSSGFLNFVRRCIYNRWFYAALAVICVLDAATDLLDIVNPGKHSIVDVLSFVASGVAAVFAGVVFLDLHLRRAKP
jgi:hypothetical protein